MKLGELRAAIRKSKAAPAIKASIGGSPVMLLLLQKGAVLDALETAFPGGKAVETGLEFDEGSGLISGPPILEAIASARSLSNAECEELAAKMDDHRRVPAFVPIIDLDVPAISTPKPLILDI